jgi:hypothetical protein
LQLHRFWVEEFGDGVAKSLESRKILRLFFFIIGLIPDGRRPRRRDHR